MRGFAAFIMRGRIQAVIGIAGLALLSLVFPLVSLFSSAAMGLVTLRQGARESGWVLVISTLVTGVLGAWVTGSASMALVYSLLLWVPVWPIAMLLRETGKLALALEAAMVLGLLAVAIAYLVVAEPAQLWQENLQRFIQPMLEHAPEGFDTGQMTQRVAFFSHYMSGLVAAGSVMSLVLGLLVARWWQAMLFNPGGFKSEFVSLKLHAASSYAFLACVALANLAGGVIAEIAWNMAVPFVVLFLIGGLAILHARLANKRKWLIGIYVALFFIPQILVPVALLGLTDTWLNWRRMQPQF